MSGICDPADGVLSGIFEQTVEEYDNRILASDFVRLAMVLLLIRVSGGCQGGRSAAL